MSKYSDMSAGDFLAALGEDAAKWAEAFGEQYPDIPADVMIGWFANAMENVWDLRCSRFTRNDEAWADFKAQVESNREFWRKLAA